MSENNLYELLGDVDTQPKTAGVSDEQILKDEKLSDGSYVVIVRFRNEEDYFNFADRIGQPKLKVYNRSIVRHTDYPLHKPQEFSLWED